MDKDGNLAAGTSTGGMTNKRYGRVGDSPIIEQEPMPIIIPLLFLLQVLEKCLLELQLHTILLLR